MSKDAKYVILYPEYFDAALSRSQGRRVPKKQAINEPTVDIIEKCAKKLKLKTKKEDAHHPSKWYEKRGRIIIRKKWKKTVTIKKIAEIMKKM